MNPHPPSPTGRLHEKVIVIIGGTGGLGRAAVLACLRQGARVLATGRDESRAAALGHELGPQARGIPLDATDPASADRAIAEAVRTFGRVDGLYHVAGGSGRKAGDGPLHELSDDGWEFTLRWNLTSVMYSNRAAIRHWLASGHPGSIVNCGSVLGYSPSPRFFATHAYAAAKAGLIGLTRSAAATYAGNGIRLNVLATALVATPMSARAQANPAIMDFIASKQPLDGGRIGQPEDLDGAAVWLLSDESRFVTGQCLAVDGGWDVSEGQWNTVLPSQGAPKLPAS